MARDGVEAMAERLYARIGREVAQARAQARRPLTAAEKALVSHRRDDSRALGDRGRSYVDFDPDRVALQDALAQMVVLQFLVAGLDETRVPTTVHCDHLIPARVAADPDLRSALDENAEVYAFLRAAASRFGLDFWEPGSGIIHQVVLEQYAFPGGMMVGTDSHTPNAGGLGMLAIGVGGGDAIDVMTGSPCNLRWPRLIGVRLTGELSGWSAPKDVILEVARQLTVSGGTGAILEYFGPGAATISATGKATICNMGAEVGATSSMFPYDAQVAAYLRATGRAAIADGADAVAGDLRADLEVDSDPGRFFDQVIDIDLSSLEPLISGPDSPDLAHRVSEVAAWARANGVPVAVSAALVGSCTNSSYEDITRAASIARQASALGLRVQAPLYVTPGSAQIRATIERDGLLADLEAIGATVLANACGPCIGQWDRPPVEHSGANTIVNSFNRNFPKRNDGSANTKAFVTSPEIVVALALAGSLDFDPGRGEIAGVHLQPPAGDALPSLGFESGDIEASEAVAPLVVSPTSDRLQLLVPFPSWDGHDLIDLPVLVKARGKCTTDHISPAGPWLRFRGHLENISGNLFLGVENGFRDAPRGHGRDPLDGEVRPLPQIAERLSMTGMRWCVVGDDNFGEGSSREHAALEIRHRGGAVVFARSFARIHETNLKKQGVLPLTFVDGATYDLIDEDDRLSVLDLASLAPGAVVPCRITRPGGASVAFECSHTLSEDQIGWFRAGSALNVIRAGVRNS